MHELSVVQNILRLTKLNLAKANAKAVEQIDLEIGDLAGIEYDAFLFAWEVAVPETVLAHARRNIHRVEGKAKCMDCQHEFKVKSLYEACPHCHSYASEMIQGRELKIKSLIVI